jgi:hypothetical protein
MSCGSEKEIGELRIELLFCSWRALVKERKSRGESGIIPLDHSPAYDVAGFSDRD